MCRGGRVKTLKNGWSCPNGKVGNGTHQEIIKYLGHLKRSVSRVREGSGLTICYAKFECTQTGPRWSRK